MEIQRALTSRAAAALLAVLILATLLPVVASPPAAASTRCVMWGMLAPSWGADVAEYQEVESVVGRSVDLLGFYQGWASAEPFDHRRAQAALDRGGVPVVAWEPYDWTEGGVHQPEFALERIIAGDFDGYIRGWARQIRGFGGPVLLRFAYEMNGNWNPWSEGVNGNEAGEYVKAWRHVHGIFDAERVSNVRWVWAPNVSTPGSPSLAKLYPGDRYVDVVGMSGYNWGTTKELWEDNWSTWQSFDDIFSNTIREIRSLTAKTIIITETASAEIGGNKAAWIRDTLARIARHPEIRGFTWFNYDKETDWRIQSSDTSVEAFTTALADPAFSCDEPISLADFDPPKAPTSGRFVDDDGNVHESRIEAIAEAGLTSGCNPPTGDRYCPSVRVTRGQMAAFLRRAHDLPASATDHFADDDGSPFEADINALADAGITGGCSATHDRFCPGQRVSRGQMAAFLRRAFDLPDTARSTFVDAVGSPFESDISALQATGITGGCGAAEDQRFCVAGHVTRAQMATFVSRAMDLRAAS